jgi:CMP/dCMP kinase
MTMKIIHRPTGFSPVVSALDEYLSRGSDRASGKAVSVKPRPVITLAYDLGVPGMAIAAQVAHQFDFHVIDREVLLEIERDTGLGEKILAALDAGKRSTVDAWIRGWTDTHHWVVDQKSFYFLLSRVIRGISLHGSAVIIGHGANFVLAGTGALRVHLTAPLELRIRAVAEGLEGAGPMSLDQARAAIEKHAAERAHLIRKYFHAGFEDPAGYDAVFNLRRLDADLGAGLIADAYRRIAEGAP